MSEENLYHTTHYILYVLARFLYYYRLYFIYFISMYFLIIFLYIVYHTFVNCSYFFICATECLFTYLYVLIEGLP